MLARCTLAHAIVLVNLPGHDASVLQRRVGELWVKVGNRLVRVDNGLEGGRDLLPVEQVPVDGREEGVFFQLIGASLRSKTILRVSVE